MGLRAVFLTMLVICAQRAAAQTSKPKVRQLACASIGTARFRDNSCCALCLLSQPLTNTQLDMCKSVSGLKQLAQQTGVANQARPKVSSVSMST
jgi:hypothetical protein